MCASCAPASRSPSVRAAPEHTLHGGRQVRDGGVGIAARPSNRRLWRPRRELDPGNCACSRGLRCRRFAGVGLVGCDGASGAQPERCRGCRCRNSRTCRRRRCHKAGRAGVTHGVRRRALRPPRAGDRRRPWRGRDRSWPRHSGGRCAGQPNAISSAWPMRSTMLSSCRRPTIWTAVGRPLPVNPEGTENAGTWLVKLKNCDMK